MGRIVKYKLFESNVDNKSYIEECFLDVLENPSFEVDDLIEVELTEKSDIPMSVYKIHIELGKDISIIKPDKSPLSQRLYTGKNKVSLDFLKTKQEKISELLEDIEIALNRVKDKFPISEYQIYANKFEEIDVVIIIKL